MAYRLDLQRPPRLGRTHKRLSSRYQVRGYVDGPHPQWGDTQVVSASPGAASPGSVYTNGYPTITASDGTNAAKLAGLGFVASPTSAWTTGQKITVNGFDFNWSGAAWAAGAHA
jgi:hypothetical protein